MRRGFTVQTNFSECVCTDREQHVVIPDDANLEYFQWATEDHSHFVDYGRDGACSKCNSKVTFDWHYIVTHEEPDPHPVVELLNDHKLRIMAAFNPIGDVYDDMEEQFNLMITKAEKLLAK